MSGERITAASGASLESGRTWTRKRDERKLLWIFSGMLATFLAGWWTATAWVWYAVPLAWLTLALTMERRLRRLDARRARAECLATWRFPRDVWRRWWSLRNPRPSLSPLMAAFWGALSAVALVATAWDVGGAAWGLPALVLGVALAVFAPRGEDWFQRRRFARLASGPPEVVLGRDGAVAGEAEFFSWNRMSSRLIDARCHGGARPSLLLTWRNIQHRGPTTLHELHVPVPEDRTLEASRVAAQLLEAAAARK